MAKGEAEFRYDNKTFILAYDFRAQALYERLMGGGNFLELMQRFGAASENENASLPISLNEVSCLFAAGMKRHHPKYATRSAAEGMINDIMQAEGFQTGLQEILRYCMEALSDSISAGKSSEPEEQPGED